MAYSTYLTTGTSVKVTATWPAYSDGSPHRGQDIVVYTNPAYIRALVAGTVLRSEFGSGSNASYGNFVQIQHSDGSCSLFAHLASRNVAVSDTVAPGDVIGIMGSTGNVTGPHVHVEYQATPWGALQDPSLITGIPNVVGTYETVYGGGGGPPPDPTPTDEWTLVLSSVLFADGRVRIFPTSNDGGGWVYFNNSRFYRSNYPALDHFEIWDSGYWANYNGIVSMEVGLFNVATLKT